MAHRLVKVVVLLTAVGYHSARASPAVKQAYQVRCSVDYFNTIVPPDFGAVVDFAVPVTTGTFGEGPSDEGYPVNATHLPNLCAVAVNVSAPNPEPPNAPSNYRFGVFLPDSGWEQKLLVVGNGGFAGGINWPQMGQGPHYGMASMSTDSGHVSPQLQTPNRTQILDWAIDRPGRQYDWGRRAMNGSVVITKQLVAGYYDQALDRSYYAGCSTGGRQGLKQIQVDPASFDGLLIGAPAWDTNHFMPWITHIARTNLNFSTEPLTKILDTLQFQILMRATYRQCDVIAGVDDVSDTIISTPEQCHLDWAEFTCPNRPPNDCLTPEQVAVARGVYGDYHTDDGAGRFVHEGLLPGSENDWPTYLGGNAPSDFDVQYERYFLYNNSSWDISLYNDSVVDDAERIDNGDAAADEIAALGSADFVAKIILYHGLADAIVPPEATARYYTRTLDEVPGAAAWLRYFPVPGMSHCWFTPAVASGAAVDVNAPWAFAAPGQATQLQLLGDAVGARQEVRQGWGTPGFRGQPEYDALLSLMAWVEGGSSVERLNAVAYDADWNVYRTRPICPVEKVAVWDGEEGTQDDAEHWNCTQRPAGGGG